MGPQGELGFPLNGTDTGLSSKVCGDGEQGERREWQHGMFRLVLGKSSQGEGGQIPGWV